MKKRLIGLIILIVLMCSSLCFASATVTETVSEYRNQNMIVVKLVAVGDAGHVFPDTTLSNNALAPLLGNYYLYAVAAYPTSGGTAPDPGDITVIDADGFDLLGGKGTNLIQAAAKVVTFPYNTAMSSYWYPPVTKSLTVKEANQDTVSADYTIELVFVR